MSAKVTILSGLVTKLLTVCLLISSLMVGLKPEGLAAPSQPSKARVGCPSLVERLNTGKLSLVQRIQRLRLNLERIIQTNAQNSQYALTPEELKFARNYFSQLSEKKFRLDSAYNLALSNLMAEMHEVLQLSVKFAKHPTKTEDLDLFEELISWAYSAQTRLSDLSKAVTGLKSGRLSPEERKHKTTTIAMAYGFHHLLAEFYFVFIELIDNDFVTTQLNNLSVQEVDFVEADRIQTLISDFKTMREALENLILEAELEALNQEENEIAQREGLLRLRAQEVLAANDRRNFSGTLNDWIDQGTGKNVNQLRAAQPYSLQLNEGRAVLQRTDFTVRMTQGFLASAAQNTNESYPLFRKLMMGRAINGEGWSFISYSDRYYRGDGPYKILKIKKKGRTHYRFLGCLNTDTGELTLKFFGLTPEAVDGTQNDVYSGICPP